MPVLATSEHALTATSHLEMAERARHALHRRLALAARGAAVVVTSRCCHVMPFVREARLAGESAADWLRAEREALARVADWARRKGFAVELRSYPGVGCSGFEFSVTRAGCTAYESLVVRRKAA